MSSVGQSVIKNLLFLKKITKTKSPKKRHQYLKLAKNEELLSIIECAYNILKGRFNLSVRQKNRLIPQINIVRQIARSRTPRGVKSVLQKGGGLGIIPALLTPIIIEAIRLIKNNGD
jgi:hypothetical protein